MKEELKMTMTEAKEWCAKEAKCVGFHHKGDPGEGPFEFTFKDHWSLDVEAEDVWTAYQKGEKIVHEELTDDELPPDPEITAEDIMKVHCLEKCHHAMNALWEKKSIRYDIQKVMNQAKIVVRPASVHAVLAEDSTILYHHFFDT